MTTTKPLADRVRPLTLDDYTGQSHLLGKDAVLRKNIEQGIIPSFIMWGPPGTGKTTLARIIAQVMKRPFYTLSAISSGVKDIRETFEKARKQQFFDTPNPILFIDEIHRFNKSQQDSLLGAVEEGLVTLIGASTENPSFEMNSALLSRCQVYILNPFTEEELLTIAKRAIRKDNFLSSLKITLKETDVLLEYAGGDGRKILNILELFVNSEIENHNTNIVITNKKVKQILQKKITEYDKNGELHHDIISAFIKSIRGSDPNAAVYWLARMVEGGEDPLFIARRLVIAAAEDIGLANPNALLLANAAFESVHKVGWPESRIILSEITIYLATSPKSNAAYMAINEAQSCVRKTGNLPVPLHLRNAPTSLMKDLNYGKNYQYAHDHKNNFVQQEFLPDTIKNTVLYKPQKNQKEEEIRKRLQNLWNKKYNY
jgi:putative ATPase